jgi:hypothetical protein
MKFITNLFKNDHARVFHRGLIPAVLRFFGCPFGPVILHGLCERRERYRKYCSMYRAVTSLRHSKRLVSVTMIAHATEEHVTSAMTSRNSRRAAGSGVATQSGPSRTVPLQWNTWYHATHINRGRVFSVASAPRLYHSNDQVVEWVRELLLLSLCDLLL